MAVAEPTEHQVEEVHCVDCGVPMPSIPTWYAGVHVRFSCDSCRQKSPRLSALPTLEVAPRRGALVADTDADTVAEDVDIDVDAADDLEVDIEDPEIVDAVEE